MEKYHDGKPKGTQTRMTLPLASEMDTEMIPSKATLTDKPSSAHQYHPNAHPMMAPGSIRPPKGPRKYPLPPPKYTLVTSFTLLPIHARPLQVTQTSDTDLFMFQDNNAWEDYKIHTDEKKKTYLKTNSKIPQPP